MKQIQEVTTVECMYAPRPEFVVDMFLSYDLQFDIQQNFVHDNRHSRCMNAPYQARGLR